VTLYARVSAQEQKADLERQVERLRQFATSRGWRVKQVVTEVGSGLNGPRRGLLRILSDPKVGRIVVEHRDRFARFGVDELAALLAAHGQSLVVVEEGEQKLDLVQDFVDVVTSMCTRVYGRRSAKNRATAALAAAEQAR
jgi:putative resolvase